MFSKVALLEAPPVDRFDNLAEQGAKALRHEHQFLVERMFEQILVHVPHKVDQAFLLWARDAVVAAVEIADQHPRDPVRTLSRIEASRDAEHT